MIDTRIAQNSVAPRSALPLKAWFVETGIAHGCHHSGHRVWQPVVQRRIQGEHRECG